MTELIRDGRYTTCDGARIAAGVKAARERRLIVRSEAPC